MCSHKKRKRAATTPKEALPAPSDLITTQLDTYTLENLVGEGTFSTVFKASSTSSNVVAAKILKDGQSDYTRIAKEFRCLLALRGHENVVQVLDGHSDGVDRFTLIMKCARARAAPGPPLIRRRCAPGQVL